MAATATAREKPFSTALLAWYDAARRDLPWRRTSNPYHIWLSEIMLQQTRVAAVIPYYERFLARFPTVAVLAAAPEQEVLAAWSGLGYYSRARNLHRAARQIAARGAFPSSYEEIRALPGIGDYTAAAIASIGFGLPHAVVDGNVLRVIARYTAEPGDVGVTAVRKRLHAVAQSLLDTARPGDFNQAMMELGATVCLPREPQCLLCPVTRGCRARQLGQQREFPVKTRKPAIVRLERTVLVVERDGALLLWRRAATSRRLAGFWELPEREQLPGAVVGEPWGEIRHGITVHSYRIAVCPARVEFAPAGFEWISWEKLAELPLSTVARKALACAGKPGN
jgi:A/G-specific adenine glycosylase